MQIKDAATGNKVGDDGTIVGCICCKDRDIFEQLLADIAATGNKYIQALVVEPTGMADGKGVFAAALNPSRQFYDNYVMAADPGDKNRKDIPAKQALPLPHRPWL